MLAAAALLAGAVLVPLAMTPTATGADKSTFTVALTGDVDSLNPFLGVEANSYEMWALAYDYLVNYSMKDMSPAPGLAKTWDTSADGKTWTFHMRDGVTWSDGQDLTARDVAFTYDRVLNGEIEGVNWSTYLNNVTQVSAPDQTTVVLTLRKPNAVLPLLPIPILPEHIWKNVSEKQMKSYANEPEPGSPVVGSGPFRLTSGTAGGSTFTFEKNPDYWNGTPHVDQVVFRVFQSKDPAVQALIKGEVDFVEDINPLQVKALQGQEGITAHNGISPLFEEIGFNTGAVDTKTGKPMGDGNPALRDPRFRHALGYAVDLDRIVKNAYQGAAEAGTTIVPSAYGGWHWEPPADVKFSFDLDKAGQLLDEAGYRKGSDGKRTMPDGRPLGTLRLFARSDSKASVDTLNFFQEWLADLGIDSKVTPMNTNRLGEVILEGTYDVFQWDWFVEPDPDSILSDFTCDQLGGLSDSWYCDKAYDAMYQQQNGEVDHAKRVEIVKKMQQQLYEDTPYIVTAYTTTGEAVRSDRFACFQPQPDPGGVWLIQYGTKNYTMLRPVEQAGDCDGVKSALKPVSAETSDSASSGGNAAIVIVGGVVVLLLLAGGGFLAVRRRATAGDRE
ncbi:MAG: ABC transporter substrate-binding protein [Nocardioidaceae bacterium]|nr:ABC transporter substrate-binding protein [Nocardioidaceae bacterium]NUS51251.1 ABC transporter substrate-binding protein [Nocardioidaceae bacterium]